MDAPRGRNHRTSIAPIKATPVPFASLQGTTSENPPFAHLGFGSFQFSWQPTADGAHSGAAYLDALSAALERTPGIRDVNLDRDAEFETKELMPPNSPPSLRNGELGFPYMGFTRLSFVIDISESVRNRFSPAGERTRKDIGTRLLVEVAQGWATAQAAVVPLDAPETFDSPSLGVAIAREFLAEAFPQTGVPGSIYFQLIGPSPAHVDISLLKAKPGTEREDLEFWRERYTRPSYGRYIFRYDSEFPSGLSAASEFFASVDSELDVFYRLVMMQRRLRLDWDEVQDEVAAIKTVHAGTGLKGIVSRLRSRRAVGDAVVSLADIELEQISARQRLTRDAKRNYGPGGTGILPELIDGEFDEFQDLPIGQVSTVLRLFEDRGLGDRELLAIAISSILGGLVGAAATLLAGG